MTVDKACNSLIILSCFLFCLNLLFYECNFCFVVSCEYFQNIFFFGFVTRLHSFDYITYPRDVTHAIPTMSVNCVLLINLNLQHHYQNTIHINYKVIIGAPLLVQYNK